MHQVPRVSAAGQSGHIGLAIRLAPHVAGDLEGRLRTASTPMVTGLITTAIQVAGALLVVGMVVVLFGIRKRS